MKKIIILPKYRLNWYKIVLLSVAIVLTGTYSITVKGQTVAPFKVNTSVSEVADPSIASTSIWANTGKITGSGIVTIGHAGFTNQNVLVSEAKQEIHFLGNWDLYSLISTSPYLRAQPVTFLESGEIESITIYHDGGTGNVLLGVYSDQSGSPSALLGVTESTPINWNADWQKVLLISPVNVKTGQTVWLSWVFENNPGVRYKAGSPATVKSTSIWSEGMPATFENKASTDFTYSIFCEYKPVDAIFTLSSTNISLGYDKGSIGTFNINSNIFWENFIDAPEWLDVSPRNGYNNRTITLKTKSINTGTSPRTATVEFHILGSFADQRNISVTQEIYQKNTTKILGIQDVYGNTSAADYRKAQPITFNETGIIESITIYQNGGTGNMLIGVYSDQVGSPSSLLGVSESTPINTTAGWQTVALINPLKVIAGQTVWLSWVFENNPGIRYTTGSPASAESTTTWSVGMPAIYGNKSFTDFKYSIYCSYKQAPYLSVYNSNIPFEIVAGNPREISITSNTSWNITTNASWLDVSQTSGSNNATIILTTNSANTGTSPRTATITISGSGVEDQTTTVTQDFMADARKNLGNITYQVWNNIGNSRTVSSLTSNTNYPNNPTSSKLITSMEGTTDLNDSYGARIVGYIHAPATGSYTFWIASDDYGELWLSTNDDPANKHKIAYVNGYTWIRTWNKYATQKSATINLVQGQKYYIEALMKEATGHDNLAVGWLKPGESGTVPSEIIPGSVLSPYGIILVSSVTLPPALNLNTGASVWLPATVLPANATVKTLNWTTSDPTVALVNSYGIVTGISAGNATIFATSTDGSNKSGTCVVTVAGVPTICSATGNITYQVWNNIGNGLTVSSLTSNINYPNNPTSTKLITSMEGTTDLGDSYGARIAGYICAPATGSYTFWIASDDYGELWLSRNDDPANKYKIAYVNGYTWIRTWNKYATQKSVTINLVQGQKYYIEALMKEATGHDNLAVGWLKPGESGTVPSQVIPGSVLSPFTEPVKNSEPKAENPALSETNVKLSVYPNPLMNGELNIELENLESDATLRIFTISGVKCYEKIFQNSGIIRVDRSVFISGIYIIKLQNESFVKTTKLIVN